MARPFRIEFAGALYHITSRGDRRDAIYEDDEDRNAFFNMLAEVVELYNWICHAFCLMMNFYLLLIETVESNLSQGMRQLNGVYTQASNRRHNRFGHLFQGRFKGILVDKEAYLLELSRYVVLNPVRAGMVDTPAQWFWSSYRAMMGQAPVPKWLAVDGLLSQFGAVREEARQHYQPLFRTVWDWAFGRECASRSIWVAKHSWRGCRLRSHPSITSRSCLPSRPSSALRLRLHRPGLHALRRALKTNDIAAQYRELILG